MVLDENWLYTSKAPGLKKFGWTTCRSVAPNVKKIWTETLGACTYHQLHRAILSNQVTVLDLVSLFAPTQHKCHTLS